MNQPCTRDRISCILNFYSLVFLVVFYFYFQLVPISCQPELGQWFLLSINHHSHFDHPDRQYMK